MVKVHDLQAQIAAIEAKCGRKPDEVRLLAVSKGKSIDAILHLYHLGIRDFCENRVAEALEKIASLPKDIRWHFIGALQRNKIRKLVGTVALIQSVESLELAQKIDKVGLELGVTTEVLIQVNTSKEVVKHGISSEELIAHFHEFLQLKNVAIIGLMTMAPQFRERTEAEVVHVRQTFSELRELQEKLRTLYPETGPQFKELSMGMSQDYDIAIEEGATMVRIGTALFS